MRIGVFGYNFKHWKTQRGLENLVYAGFKPAVVLAANKKKLNIRKAKIRTAPKGLFLTHPKDVCEYHKIDYHIIAHDTKDTISLVKKYDLDLGIILGARILPKETIDAFKLGVINLHPGVLPENRGLDTIKWAICGSLPQGVTAHFVDEKIDRGREIVTKVAPIYNDDTLLDLKLRIQNLEQELMIESLRQITSPGFCMENLALLGRGNYHSTITENLEASLLSKFESYKNDLSVKEKE